MFSAHSKVKLKDSISAQVLKVSFTVYCAVTILVTLFHLVGEYRNTKQDIFSNLEAVETSFGKGLGQAIWDMNRTQLTEMSKGILESPNVVGIKIEFQGGTEAMGIVINSTGTPIKFDPKLEVDIPIHDSMGRGLFFHTFDLIHDDGYSSNPRRFVTTIPHSIL